MPKRLRKHLSVQENVFTHARTSRHTHVILYAQSVYKDIVSLIIHLHTHAFTKNMVTTEVYLKCIIKYQILKDRKLSFLDMYSQFLL